MPLTLTTDPSGVAYRDLNRNGIMDPYEDPRRPIAERVEDLLTRLSLPEKVGLMFQTVIEAGPDGSVVEGPGDISKSATSTVIKDKHLTHFNIHKLGTPRDAARWHNAVQELAEHTRTAFRSPSPATRGTPLRRTPARALPRGASPNGPR